jgi:hypothetical protein
VDTAVPFYVPLDLYEEKLIKDSAKVFNQEPEGISIYHIQRKCLKSLNPQMPEGVYQVTTPKRLRHSAHVDAGTGL